MDTKSLYTSPTAVEDSELVKRFQNGDDRALETLVNRHRAKMISNILHVVKDREIAEDLYQEAMIKIVQVIRDGRYNEKGKFFPWAMRVARNLAIDFFRKEKRNPQVNVGENVGMLENLYASEENRERQMVREEKKRFVRELIRELPEKQREVLIMRHYNHMSFKEIAKLTDVSINTALGRMRYALVNLQKLAEARGYRQ